MQNIIQKIVSEYARDMNVLIVDDDETTLEIYKGVFEEIFDVVDAACDGQEAYELWSRGKRKYDLIITDLMMPKMDGFELIDKVRLRSPSQHIIVLSAIVDINEMRNILDLGIDGILVKPYNQEKMLKIFSRVLKLIYNDKLLKRQAFQLRLLAKENIKTKVILNEKKENKKIIHIKKTEDERRSDDRRTQDRRTQNNATQVNPVQEKRTQVEKIAPPKNDNKYHTRAHLNGETAEDFTADLDYFDMDRVEVFQDKIEHFQNVACDIVSADSSKAKEDLTEITEGLLDLIELLNHFGRFSVTAGAARKLITFIDNLGAEDLSDYDKKDLFVDGLMSILEDLYKWIDMVFVQKNTDNINYFDASFANTCLELESIFVEVPIMDEEEAMEFF